MGLAVYSMPLDNNTLRVAIVASGPAYQEAGAWAASTFARYLAHPHHVAVLLPEQEWNLDLLKAHSERFGFSLERFPFRPISERKFTSQLKCQAFWFVVSHLNPGELLLLADADTCCFKPVGLAPETTTALRLGRIGLVADIADHHSQTPTDPWFLTSAERLTYVNSGVVFASSSALDLFRVFRDLSEQDDFLRGPFNDQKIINFALGKHFRDRLLLLDEVYNHIRQPFPSATIIGHFAGGAGYLGSQGRKLAHQTACSDVLRSAEQTQAQSEQRLRAHVAAAPL